MSTFSNYLLQKGQSNSTTQTHQRNLGYFLVWCDQKRLEADLVRYADLIAYLKYLRLKPVKARTIQVYLNTLQHYFDWIIERGIREDNPVRNIEIKGIERNNLYNILTPLELEALYQNYQKQDTLAEKRNRVIIGLIIWQGLATGDLQRLSTNDLDLQYGEINVPGSRRSNKRKLKLEAQQILPLMDYLMNIRKQLLEERQSDNLILSTVGSETLHNTVDLLIRQLKKQHSKVTSIKQLRASVIIQWIKAEGLRKAQYKAGHRYISSTENYLINELEDLKEDIEKYHPMG